jgi:hypothetical protein
MPCPNADSIGRMAYKSAIKPEVLRARIVRVKAELRRLKMELKLSEAEERDRGQLDQLRQQFLSRPEEEEQA